MRFHPRLRWFCDLDQGISCDDNAEDMRATCRYHESSYLDCGWVWIVPAIVDEERKADEKP